MTADTKAFAHTTAVAWRGDISLTIRRDGVLTHHRVRNVVSRLGRDTLRDALQGTGNPEITWVALGSGADAASDEDTLLQTEEFRKLVTSQSPLGIGQLLTTMYVAEGEANDFIIREIGWFSEATSTPDSGVLMARVVVDPFSGAQKTPLETLQIDRTDSIVEAT